MRTLLWTSLRALPIRALCDLAPPVAAERAAPPSLGCHCGPTNETTMGTKTTKGPIYLDAVAEERADAPASNDRVVRVVASTEALDSHGTIVKSNWSLDRFNANPVVLWAHRRDEVPIGTAVAEVKGKRLVADITFPPEGEFARADEVYKAWKAKLLRGISVGFYPHTVTFEKKNDVEVMVMDDNELLEISFVPVQSNPETLADQREAALAEFRAAAVIAEVAALVAGVPPAETTPAATVAAPVRTAAEPATPQEHRMDPKVIALALGLPEDATESQIRTAASAAFTGLGALLGALGVTTVDAARGAIEAGRAAIAELPKSQARVKELETAAENAERAGIIGRLEAEKRLTPAQRDGFAKTASLEALRSFAETAPVIVAASLHHEAPPAPAAGAATAPSAAPVTVDGKRAYEHLTGPERVALQQSDLTTFNAVRSSWISRGRPEVSAAG